MPQVLFTAHLRRWAPPSPVEAAGDTVAAALDQVFAQHPLLETYVLDDQRRLRRHIAVFVDGERARLADPVGPDARIAVLQALSGG
jgi:molybdopterin synthase sulfur carrier subunit